MAWQVLSAGLHPLACFLSYYRKQNMMRYRLTLALLLATSATAQSSSPTMSTAVSAAVVSGTLSAIEVSGTTDLLTNLIEATLSVKAGTALSELRLEEIEKEVMGLGYFSTVKAQLNGSVLHLEVQVNPTILAVSIKGMTFINAEVFKQKMAELLNIAEGALLNTARLEEAKQALVQNYKQLGFPFTPKIEVNTQTSEKGVVVEFSIDETAPLSRTEVNGVTLVEHEKINKIFTPLVESKKFTPESFMGTLAQLERLYSEAGYAGFSIDPASISLKDGVLSLTIREGIAGEVDTTVLGDGIVDTAALATKAGLPIRRVDLEKDARLLSNQLGKPVTFAIENQPNNQPPKVVFSLLNIETAPIKDIAFVGNTKISAKELAEALEINKGDIYNPVIIENQFLALRELYRKQGYEISTRDAYDFKDGTLTFFIREVNIVGYRIDWQGKHQTKDEVIIRELPEKGLFNLNKVRGALGNISRLGYVNIVGEGVEENADNPENVTYVLRLSEQKQGIPINLSLGYDTLGGWNGEVGYENNNVFGMGHNFNIRASAANNQAKQNWSGNANYTIPWIDLDFADFKKKRTSATLSVYSNVEGNASLLDEAKKDTGRDISQRTTGFGISLSRRITPYLSGSLGGSFNRRDSYLESIQPGEITAVDDAKAKELLPKETRTGRIQAGLNYDKTDDFLFPGEGERVNLSIGYSNGRTGDKSLSWTDLQVGGSKYFGFGEKKSQAYGDIYKNVVAVRLNYGTYLGTFPDGTNYTVGGSSANPASELRGLNDGQLSGVRYLTSSLEYRRDFGVNSSFAQGLYGVLWADYGGVWNINNEFKSAYGLGAGLQLSLGFGGAQLPTLRFDYGWSPARADINGNKESGGKFMFRIGNFW